MKRALLIGIDQYPDPRNNLNSCVADTLKFKDMLIDNYGFTPGDIRLLHNNFATIANVRTAFDNLMRNANPGDELVYFESSHGYRYPDGDTMVEVLCLYDEFLTDTEFAQRTQGLPPGVLTVVLDACHSGGMNKIFFSPNGPAVARVKVWQPPTADAVAHVQQAQQVTRFKFFGRAAVAQPADVASAFSVGQAVTTAFARTSASPQQASLWSRKEFSAGDVELNGALFSACQADQTAAAGTPATAGLSAFTFALTEQIDTTISLRALCARTVARLQSLHMSQTPEVHTPFRQPQLADETFITMQPAPPAAPSPAPIAVQPPATPTAVPDAVARALGAIFATAPGTSPALH